MVRWFAHLAIVAIVAALCGAPSSRRVADETRPTISETTDLDTKLCPRRASVQMPKLRLAPVVPPAAPALTVPPRTRVVVEYALPTAVNHPAAVQHAARGPPALAATARIHPRLVAA